MLQVTQRTNPYILSFSSVGAPRRWHRMNIFHMIYRSTKNENPSRHPRPGIQAHTPYSYPILPPTSLLPSSTTPPPFPQAHAFWSCRLDKWICFSHFSLTANDLALCTHWNIINDKARSGRAKMRTDHGDLPAVRFVVIAQPAL